MSDPIRRSAAIAVLFAAVAAASACGGSGGGLARGGEPPAAPTTQPVAATSPTAPADSTEATPTSTIAVAPVDAPPEPLTLPADPALHAAAILDGIDAEGDARLAATLAAYRAARLPVLDAAGSSLTTDVDDPVGVAWDHVWASSSVPASHRVSITDVVSLMHLTDPTAPFDDTRAAAELLGGLRAALALPDPQGVSFVARLVAEDARRANGVDLADPGATSDEVTVHWTTAELLLVASIRGVYEQLVAAGDLPAPGAGAVTSAAPHGFRRPDRTEVLPTGALTASGAIHPATAPPSNCSSDGAQGWLLFAASKLAAGIKAPGLPFEWGGLFNELNKLGGRHGWLNQAELEFGGNAAKLVGYGTAVLNVGLFLSQLGGFRADVALDGSGPLVRTKSDRHGEARTITATINYDDRSDPKIVDQRNCMLLAAGALGNSSLIAVGPAAGVQVTVEGGRGFANGLAAGDSQVLFGPATFQPVQTADDAGQVAIPVQGRAQPRRLPNSVTERDATFSVYIEASLDPVTATTLARSLIDDLLCVGSVLAGGGSDAVAECQNAAINKLKQFHWDLGEHSFALTDWAADSWVIDVPIGPFRGAGSKCDGDTGEWIMTIAGSIEGITYYADVRFRIDPETLEGSYELDGAYEGAGMTLTQADRGRVILVRGADGSRHIEFQADHTTLDSSYGGFSGALTGGTVIPLVPADPGAC